MVRDVLSPDDFVTVWTFSTEEKMTQLYYMTRASNIQLDVLQAKVHASGCTRLYDNCVRALDSMRKSDDVKDCHGNTILRQLVVFTDGCDNQSAAGGLDRMVQELRAPDMPNFNFTMLAVGSDGKVEGEKLQARLAVSKRCKVIITESATPDEIGRAFGKAQACLRQAKQELIETLTVVSHSSNAQPTMGRVLESGFAMMSLNGGGGQQRGLPSSGSPSRHRRSASASRNRHR
ncbi:hypothetical protein TSOC_013780 [Tetrabaena socialis]|uniref:VWFA domain-containing protein n=1 Tax=Tetrabaena socialis TaxID=47790 RepID=A0A2J7ZJG0_9CHLO|nr:hypothetical protein TSOC_013780 [Tetrabaena socialis]|eukprot:PNH00402.1 hypothetical protein TSOC_013780 [Tetrabaena socialis]